MRPIRSLGLGLLRMQREKNERELISPDGSHLWLFPEREATGKDREKNPTSSR